MTSRLRVALPSAIGLTAFVLVLFVPAGTLHYWRGWAFLAVFSIVTLLPGLYLRRNDPAALERRTHAGPGAETRTVQKIVITATFVVSAALVVVSVLDYRFGWSRVPVGISVLGDVLVAGGLGLSLFVVVQNRYASANITVEDGQPLVSTGLYGFVRHPMYFGTVIMMVGIPLALGSYWGLLLVIPGVILLVVRIIDEEKMLTVELAGYRDYMQKVRYRLAPLLW